MPIVAQIICDGCEAVKKETNHWYTLVINNNHEACLRPMSHTPPSLLQLGALQVSYFCGMRCAIDGITHWMDQLASYPKQGSDCEDAAIEIFNSEVPGQAGRARQEKGMILGRPARKCIPLPL